MIDYMHIGLFRLTRKELRALKEFISRETIKWNI